MLDANLGTAVLRTKLDAAGLSTGLGQAEQQIRAFSDRSTVSIDKLATGFTRVGKSLSLFVTAPIVGLGVAFTKAASDAEETASKFATVFRSIGDRAEETADTLASSFGLSSTNARRLLGDTGDLLTGFGFTQEAALDLSREVNELAVDLASFTNFQGGAEGASAALTKALLGETEAAKSLGIAIRADLVTAKIEELRASGQLVGATEAQAKAYATLAIAQEQSLNAIGDYSRTSGSFANQLRLLRSNVNDLAVTFGEVLLPAATKIVSGLASIVDTLGNLPPVARNAIVVFSGLAAAAGPLLIGLGQILTAVQAIGPALIALRVAALPLLGPAGLILGAVGLVGGLALAFSGRGDSLDSALANVSTAAAGGDQASVVGALERLKDRVDESAVPAIQRMIDKLQETGELSAELRAELDQLVTGFDRTAAEAELASVRTRIAALEAQGIGAREDTGDPAEFLPFRQEQLDRALVNAGFNQGDLRFVLDESGAVTLRAFADAVRSTRDPNVPLVPSDAVVQQIVVDTIAAARSDQSSLLSPLLRRQAELEAQLATSPAPAAGGGFGGGGGGGGGGSSANTVRTVRTVFDEIAARGAAAVRIAAFEGTPEAALEGIETRIALFDNAVEELLTSFAGDVTDAQLDYIRERRDALRAEAERLRAALEDTDEAAETEIARILDPGAQARLRAQARDQAGRIAVDTVFAVLAEEVFDPEKVLEAIGALRRVSPELASAFEGISQIARIAAADFASGFLDPGTRARLSAEARAGATAIALDTVQAYAAAFESGAEGLDPDEGLVALRRLRELSPELAAEFDNLNRALLVLAASAEAATGAVAPDPAGDAARAARDQGARTIIALDTFVSTLNNLDAAPQDVLDAYDALKAANAELAASFAPFVQQARLAAAALESGSGFADPGQLAAARAEQDALARLIAVDTVEALIAAGAETDLLVAALERLRAIAPEAAAAFDERLARPIPIPGVDVAYTPPQGLEGIFGPGTSDEFRGIFDESGQQLVTASEYSSAQIQDAAVRFSAQVAQAAIDFTFGLIDAIKRGDVAGAVGQGLNLAGSVAGGIATFGGALGLSAATVATAGIAAIALPLIGGLVSGLGGLFGGNRGAEAQESEREAEARRRARQTPAFSVRISVSQTNNYSSTNADPQVRADNDRRTRQVVADVLREIDFPALRRAALGSPL